LPREIVARLALESHFYRHKLYLTLVATNLSEENAPARIGVRNALPRLLVPPAWEDHVAISLIQPDAATSNQASAIAAPVKTADPGQSEFARALQSAGDSRTGVASKPQGHPVNGSAGPKANSTTTEKNGAATIARKDAKSPSGPLATALEKPITLPMNIALSATTTTTTPTLPATDHSPTAIGDVTPAGTLSDLPASETEASQNQSVFQPALPIDTEPTDASDQSTKPTAIAEDAGGAAQSPLSLPSDPALVYGIDSILETEATAQPKAQSKTNAVPTPQLVMSLHDHNSAAAEIVSPAPTATQPQEDEPLGLTLRTTFQSGLAPKAASPSQASKTNSSHSSVAVAQTEPMSVADNFVQRFQNAQFNSGSEYPLVRAQDAATDASDFTVLPGSTDPGTVPAFPQTSSSDPSATVATITNVLSQIPLAGDQPGSDRSPSFPEGPPSAASSSPPEPSVVVASAVQVARIVETMGQSEMHIGLRTQAFGSVEVHTTVHDTQVGLAVGSEKGDLRTFLASEMPGIQASLRQQDLRFDHIRFLEPGSANTGFSGGDSSQSRSSSQGHPFAPSLPVFASEPATSAQLEVTLDGRTGLNVHA
jgi:hypothetical protein